LTVPLVFTLVTSPPNSARNEKATFRGGFFLAKIKRTNIKNGAFMKIVVVTKKPVLTQFGRLAKDIPVDVPDQLAKFLIERGDAVAFEVKERIDRPFVDAGKVAPLSAAPAAQASTSETLESSELGAKRRGRPRKEALSSQTPPTE
jgi:hypothetical protein